ncbi:MAG: hypothetical protein EOP49_15205, partial [Sphingobacteriales bacterium]
MRISQLFTKTSKSAPADEVAKNAQLLIRAGFIHKEMAGVYAYLPLGLRVLENIKKIVREEMNAIGGQEVAMTTLQPRDIWEKTDRWDDKKVDNWFKTKLSNGTELGVGLTHEEPIVDAIGSYLSSYKDMPFYVYQIQNKFRNELRAKSGLLRGREFLMKDMYTFSPTQEVHEKTYETVVEAYHRVYARLGLGDVTYRTYADGGIFTPRFSDEFQTISPVGEDTIYVDQIKKIAINEEIYTDENLKKLGLRKEDLVEMKGVEVGNTFHLESKYTDALEVYYTDENGDDKPDKKEIFLTGFGGLDHDHSLHAMTAGPDGKYYFNAGNAGPHMVTDKSGWNLRSGSNYNGGSPYNNSNKGGLVSDDGKMWVGGIAMRVNPDGTGLKVLGHNFRNSYEFTVDSYGNMWQNDNDDDGNRGVRVSWVMEGANMGYASADGTRRWQADRRPDQSTVDAHWHQQDPGVLPLGDNTGAGSPTGVAFNESDLLGEKYRGMLMACDAGRNVVFAYKPQTNGAGYDLNRQNLITSLSDDEVAVAKSSVGQEEKTKWFRPSDVVVGADGAIYVADWYDSMVGGHRMTDTTGTGRIYRITPKGKKLTTPKINLKNTKGQIAALLSPAVNVRNAGFVLLAAKGSKAVKDVKKILSSTNPYHKARAIWLLSNMGPTGLAAVEEALKDSDPNIRITAFRALRQVNKDISTYAMQLSKDLSPAVRREVAVALRDMPANASGDAIVTLAAAYGGTDRFYLEALGLAAEGKEETLYPILNAKLGAEPLKWTPAFADIVWRLHPKAALSALKQRAASGELTADQRKQAIVAIGFIKDQSAVDAMQELLSSSNTKVKEQAL